jgi:hypothetical protein
MDNQIRSPARSTFSWYEIQSTCGDTRSTAILVEASEACSELLAPRWVHAVIYLDDLMWTQACGGFAGPLTRPTAVEQKEAIKGT